MGQSHTFRVSPNAQTGKLAPREKMRFEKPCCRLAVEWWATVNSKICATTCRPAWKADLHETKLFKTELTVKLADMTFVTQMSIAFDQRRAIFVERVWLSEIPNPK